MLILNTLTAVACVYILGASLSALNRMTGDSDHLTRAAHVLMCFAACVEFAWALDIAYTPNRIFGAVFTISCAVAMAVIRRRRAAC